MIVQNKICFIRKHLNTVQINIKWGDCPVGPSRKICLKKDFADFITTASMSENYNV